MCSPPPAGRPPPWAAYESALTGMAPRPAAIGKLQKIPADVRGGCARFRETTLPTKMRWSARGLAGTFHAISNGLDCESVTTGKNELGGGGPGSGAVMTTAAAGGGLTA